eukprot:921189-Pyramimonas_sp.AAC.1
MEWIHKIGNEKDAVPANESSLDTPPKASAEAAAGTVGKEIRQISKCGMAVECEPEEPREKESTAAAATAKATAKALAKEKAKAKALARKGKAQQGKPKQGAKGAKRERPRGL